MTDCNGDGFCLRQGGGPNLYELNDCPHKCKPIECPNFKICGSILPKCITFCHSGTCMNCSMSQCNGDGSCLIGLQRSKNMYHISYCIHNCMPVKCPNFLVCSTISQILLNYYQADTWATLYHVLIFLLAYSLLFLLIFPLYHNTVQYLQEFLHFYFFQNLQSV